VAGTTPRAAPAGFGSVADPPPPQTVDAIRKRHDVNLDSRSAEVIIET
jgi:hypothetical protein